MEYIASLTKYSLGDFYGFMGIESPYSLDHDLQKKIKEIDNEIVPIIVEKSSEKTYKPKHDNHKNRSRGGGNGNGNGGGGGNGRGERGSQYKKDDLSWEDVRSFKTTKIEKKEGKDRIFNDIRICLNKLSTKNYDTQKEKIFELLDELKETSVDDNTTNTLQTVSETIFDIASTNMFYAEIYAKLYKELIQYDDVFNTVMHSFLLVYANSIKDIKYVDPEVDYENYCGYNKKNDMRKATAVFIISLMKENVIPVLKVMSLIVSFQEFATQYVDQENRTNEVEEVAEVLFLFLDKGISVFANCKAEWIWKFVITKHIMTFSKYKKNEKKSLTSRAIFKYMDMAQLIEKTTE